MVKPSVIPFVPRPQREQPPQEPIKTRRWFRRRRSSKDARERRQAEGWRAVWARWSELAHSKMWLLVIMLVGFLLGRAVMLEGLTPFAAAFFAVVLYVRREHALWAAVALVGGSLLSSDPAPLVIGAEIVIIYLLYKGLELYERADLSQAPIVVFTATLLVRLFHTVMMERTEWLPYVLTFVEAGLSAVLTLLFLHAMPVLSRTASKTKLRHEEWIGALILVASIMTGFVGWSVQGVALENVLSRFIVLLFALAAGPLMGAAAGVVAGMVLSLSDLSAVSQIGLLAFGGLLAGLIREGGKAAAMFGMLLGTSVLALYSGTAEETLNSAWASVAAAVLLFATPKSLIRYIARYVPGTSDYAHSQHDYAKKVRDLTAERVEKFSEVFRQLSRSFRQITYAGENARQTQDFDHFVSAVHEKNCSSCHRYNQCWDGQFFQTYKLLTDMMSAVEAEPDMTPSKIPKSWNRHCVKTPQVLDVLKRQYDLYRHDQVWRRQIQDSRLLVADQLHGVSQVMDDLVKEIRREAKEMSRQEEQIRGELDRLGLAIQSIDIVSLEEGHVEIEIVHAFRPGFDECRKVIAPLLSDILGETVSVVGERSMNHPGYLTSVTFGSAKAFEVDTGIAGAAKDGDWLSGDSFGMVELGNGKFAVSLSDGMGNGARARMESSAALSMLEQLLQSGIDERLAVKSVNSVLLLRSPEEMFATVDMALIDLYTGQATLLKIGSTPSFIKRGREVIPVDASNLPIGIVEDIEIDVLQIELRQGDILVMMTDGILDAPDHAVNKEQWVKRVLQEIDSDDPQEVADSLLDMALRQYPGGGIRDDMTVIATRITRHQPEWAAFRWPGAGRFERPRTVS
ncbi:stage II sporulation protein E [Cohnella lubricantis]|uniref:Stage II sporulation protein E n=1 Tax=Cohnella lubricantis TaxID=2163172 RepID=A0A841TKI4_9BACL|nr:stage II sporulation protein E [Cohnella lubricantis]MBB6679708.1 stage II sporulation protein E [Cohnella lubricantis]MBP2119370.1 stage II sporulation protein E [Cohnella lubricantis]